MTRWSETDVRANVVPERGLRIPEVVRREGVRALMRKTLSPTRKTTRLFTAAPAPRDPAPLPARAFHGPEVPLAPPPLAARTSPRPWERISARRLIFVLVVLALVLPFAVLYADATSPSPSVAASVDDANSPHVPRRRRSNRSPTAFATIRAALSTSLSPRLVHARRPSLRLRDESVTDEVSPPPRAESCRLAPR